MKKKEKKPVRVCAFEIMQQAKNDENTAKIKNGEWKKLTEDMLLTVDDIAKLGDYYADQGILREWFTLPHDSDNDDSGTPETVHIHAPFLLSQEKTFDDIAADFLAATGKVLPTSQISKCRCPAHNWETKFAVACAYLTHEIKEGAGNPDNPHHKSINGEEWDWDGNRWLYDKSQVVGSGDFDAWLEVARKYYAKKAEDNEVEEILDRIAYGEIRECEYYLVLTPRMIRRTIRQAGAMFVTAHKRAEQNPHDKMIILIEGDGGAGKSWAAVQLCKRMGWTYTYSASGEHMFDNYTDQQAIILDDCRASTMKYSDLLKVLDPHGQSELAARYHNKCTALLEVIIITTTQPYEDWYKDIRENAGEQAHQLNRRISTIISLRDGAVKIKEYDEKNHIYVETSNNKWLFDPEQIFGDVSAPKESVADIFRRVLSDFIGDDLLTPEQETEREAELSNMVNDNFVSPYVDIDNKPDIGWAFWSIIASLGISNSDPCLAPWVERLAKHTLTEADLSAMTAELSQMRLIE